MVSDGVAPPEPEGSEFTARPATNYGITPHIGSRSRSRTRSVGVKFQSVYHYTNRLYVIRVKTNDLSVFNYNLIQKKLDAKNNGAKTLARAAIAAVIINIEINLNK